MSLVVAVSHTPWIPERARSMERLRQAFGVHGSPEYGADIPRGTGLAYFEMTDRAHVSVWSGRMWQRALEMSRGEGHCAFFQDDDEGPRFVLEALRAILDVVPDQLIGLHLHHPGAVAAHRAGERFVTTTSCVGVGYVLPAPLLADFVSWRASQSAEYLYRTSEDNLLDAWAIHRKRRVWHPVPTVVRPDRTLGSTGGGGGRDAADDQYMRSTVLSWEGFKPEDLKDPAWWRAGLRDPPRHLVFAGIARPGVSMVDMPAGFDGHHSASRARIAL